MTEAEYHLIISEQLHLISSIWEYWLASTFAFIVAFHAGRKSITKPLAFIGCGLYMMASVAAILRYVRTVGKIDLLKFPFFRGSLILQPLQPKRDTLP